MWGNKEILLLSKTKWISVNINHYEWHMLCHFTASKTGAR